MRKMRDGKNTRRTAGGGGTKGVREKTNDYNKNRRKGMLYCKNSKEAKKGDAIKMNKG